MPVNSHCHMLILVCVDPDDHLNSSIHLATGCYRHSYLLEDGAQSARADKTATGLVPRSCEVTAPIAVDAVWAIPGSSRQINSEGT